MSLKVKSNGINFNVPTIEDLPTERLEEDLVCVVTDENRGGVFVYREANALVNNGGTIFNGWTRQYDGAVNVKWFGAKGDGVSDDTLAIQNCFSSQFTDIHIEEGTYLVSKAAGDTSSVTLFESTLDNRNIYGDGVITANSQIKRLLTVSGNNNRITININGNNQIGYGIICTGENPTIENCVIENLNGMTTWGGVGIRVSQWGIDSSAYIKNNIIRNCIGAGDGIEGYGAGMQRAVMLESDVERTNKVYVANNIFENISGEEGDVVVTYCRDKSTLQYYNFPVEIVNNKFKGWTRRAVKLQAGSSTVINNIFDNTGVVDSALLQKVVDFVQGSDHSVVNNTFINCKYQSQISGWMDAAEAPISNIKIINNTFVGLGEETDEAIVALNTYGSNVVISNNTIDAPNHLGYVFYIFNTSGLNISHNIISSPTYPYFKFSGITTTSMYGNIVHGNTDKSYSFYLNPIDNRVEYDMSYIKGIYFRNNDTSVSNNEVIGRLGFIQNDSSTPNTAIASIGFVGEGASGSLGIGFFTGGVLAPDTEKVRISSGGILRPIEDNTQYLGDATHRWSTVYAGTGIINTSDAREKTFFSTDEAETLVAKELKSLMKKFKFNDAIAIKGEKARIHYGTSAQEVIHTFEKHGLNAMEYAFICYDEWEEQEEAKDEDGNITQEYRPAGNRYGIRYEELLCFIISAM